MIIDTLAILAIHRDEPDALRYAKAIAGASSRRVSAVNSLEAAAVIDGSRNPVASRRFDDFFCEAEIEIEPVAVDQSRLAREAYPDFGKRSGPSAGRNFGDCFAYALAKAIGEPLLFKGDNFTGTDVSAALPEEFRRGAARACQPFDSPRRSIRENS